MAVPSESELAAIEAITGREYKTYSSVEFDEADFRVSIWSIGYSWQSNGCNCWTIQDTQDIYRTRPSDKPSARQRVLGVLYGIDTAAGAVLVCRVRDGCGSFNRQAHLPEQNEQRDGL